MNDSITNLRNKHIVNFMARQVVKAAKTGRTLTDKELIESVMTARPAMHYVSYEKASRILHLIDREGVENIDKLRTSLSVRQKWLEMYCQVKDVMGRRKKCTFGQALTFVLHFCRPSSFYVSEDTVRRLILRNFRICRCALMHIDGLGGDAVVIIG